MTPAEIRDQSLRKVEKPASCVSCIHNSTEFWGCNLDPSELKPLVPFFYVCDLHARKPDGGSDAQ